MQLSELINIVLVRAGQVIVDDLTELQFTVDKFSAMLKPELAKYNKYIPKTIKENIVVSGNFYAFPNDTAPEWVSEMVPVDLENSTALIVSSLFNWRESTVRQPVMNLWRYDKPKLHTTGTGQYEVTCHYYHKLTDEVRNPQNNELTDATLQYITENDDLFIDLITGRFLITLGRSRRSYKVDGFPFNVDDDQLVSEGQTLYENTLQLIYDNSEWVHAMGG